ncbi:helix-turn-helix domain-containing protein [Nibrella saemangeumensis]|uniref:Helix-turn-helix domain-containing protein n=1 Tax=Nibrella saemangeumensis TaxID=1084526 RepID=A0ABP8MVA7_9BACT
MPAQKCPKCESTDAVRNGVINDRQRFRCRQCGYNFTVDKVGKGISTYYVIKALQLYIEGVSFREIERLLGISHVSVMNWVKKYQVKVPEKNTYHPTYKILSHKELADFMNDRQNMAGAGMIVTELGDKFMLIKWERFRD